jgi:hypothetical protein
VTTCGICVILASMREFASTLGISVEYNEWACRRMYCV